jgi:RimJ/RimL family protein N-acetyltransferase
MWIDPVTLERDHVALRPLTVEDATALAAAAADGELWQLWYTSVPTPDGAPAYVAAALERQETRGELPFAVVRAADGVVVGTTRFCNPFPSDRRLEIGYTWYAASAQRTAVNTEAKYLLLTHAFEVLHAIAVEFRTHWLNHQSRRAIERLGAKQDGVLRNHRIMPDGSYRDTVVYSIIESEWPAVKRGLEYRLRAVR